MARRCHAIVTPGFGGAGLITNRGHRLKRRADFHYSSRFGSSMSAQLSPWPLGLATVDGLKVRSRRGWNMTEALPELRGLPEGLVLDGELVAFNKAGDPHFPLLSKRILNLGRSVAVQMMVLMCSPSTVNSLVRRPTLHTSPNKRKRRGPRWRGPLRVISQPSVIRARDRLGSEREAARCRVDHEGRTTLVGVVDPIELRLQRERLIPQRPTFGQDR